MSAELIALLIFGYFVSKSAAIKCYTCVEEKDNNLSCSNFEMEDPRFIRECEIGSKSCRLSRKVNENIILTRSCENLQLDDCKTANFVEFCYCTKDLCNKINPSDDEGDEESLDDLLEGSGSKRNHFDTTTEAKSSNHDIIIVSTGKSNVDLQESVDTNKISSGCSISTCEWCLVCITLLYLFIYVKQY